jgi:hypothetical protein
VWKRGAAAAAAEQASPANQRHGNSAWLPPAASKLLPGCCHLLRVCVQAHLDACLPPSLFVARH